MMAVAANRSWTLKGGCNCYLPPETFTGEHLRDGYVLPADMTSQLINNNKINAKVQAAASQGQPRLSGAGYASGVSSSGNLIKQMGAMMSGGNTQRITNNVTIQSQNPVMDASKIMANVARMKARRGAI